MCATSSIIEFENDCEFYRPGEAIKGLVIFNINQSNSILIKALSLHFNGYAYTRWEKFAKEKKMEKSKPKTFLEYREDYISTTNYLIGSEMASPKRFEPGNYRYNFMIHIPLNIPSTFDSPLGIIRYEFSVNADYGDHISTLYNIPIKIDQLKDLREMDTSVQLPAETQQLEHKSFIKFWQQPLQLYVSVPQRAFIAGECITLHIKLTNYEKIKIQTITSNLNRIATYKGLVKEKSSETTLEKTTISSNLHNLYGQNLKQTQVLLEIFIPKTPPSMSFDECKCISLSYELEVLVTCQNKKRWVRTVIPILVGSVSLRSDLKILPSNSNNENVAAITWAQSMDNLSLPSAMDLQGNLSALQTSNISASIGSLASSFQEANFMSPVQLNKKRHQIVGDLKDFKPKYLYYDLHI